MLCQAHWKPLLWDWTQKQPCVRSCAAIAKANVNLHQDAGGSEMMAKQEQPGRAMRKEVFLELGRAALLLSSTVQERSKTKRAML